MFIQFALLLLLSLANLSHAQASPAALTSPATPAHSVIHYQLELEPDLATRKVRGQLVVDFVALEGAVQGAPLRLQAGELTITQVVEGEGKQALQLGFRKQDGRLEITLPIIDSTKRRVTITYEGAPRVGMSFLPDARQIFTAFSTDQWMPCDTSPAARASFGLALIVPAEFKTVSNGRFVAATTAQNGKARFEWRQDEPVPAYTLGFAAGEFREVLDENAAPILRFLVPPEFTEAQTREIFQQSRAVLAFFTSKAGLPYPDASYTQVLVSGGAAQEMSGFAVMGAQYGRRVLASQTSAWLGAHEIAHQWWGNRVTNRAWTEFWLNEGLATFMTAAYFEAQFGAEQYQRHIDAANVKLAAVRAAGQEKLLRFTDWSRPSAADRSVVYDKGALFFHAVRELLHTRLGKEAGEAAFWAGIKSYTQMHWGKAVGSEDLQRALMQQISLERSEANVQARSELKALFNEWVFGP